MNKERWAMLMKYPEFFEVTDEEHDSGWHYCPEFSYLLVGPGMDEWDMCSCFEKIVEDDDVKGTDMEDTSKGKAQGVRSRDDDGR